MFSAGANNQSSSVFGGTSMNPTFGGQPFSTPMFGASTNATSTITFGSNTFGAQSQGFSGFSSTAPQFGATAPAFGQPNVSLFGSSTVPTIVVAATPQSTTENPKPFGTSGFNFGGANTVSGPFGTSASTAAAFGSTTATPLFAAPTNKNIFGGSSTTALASSFGAAAPMPSSGFSATFGNALSQQAITSSNATGFSFGAASTAQNLSAPRFGAPTTTVAPSFGAIPVISSATPFSTTTANFGLAGLSSTTPFSTAANFGGAGLSSTTPFSASTANFGGAGLSFNGASTTNVSFGQVNATSAFATQATTSATGNVSGLSFGGSNLFGQTSSNVPASSSLFANPQPSFNAATTQLGTNTTAGFSFTSGTNNVAAGSGTTAAGTVPVQSVAPSFFTNPATVATSNKAAASTTLTSLFNFSSQPAAPIASLSNNIVLPTTLPKTTNATLTGFSTAGASTGLVSSTAIAATLPTLPGFNSSTTNQQLSTLLSTPTPGGTKATSSVSGLASVIPASVAAVSATPISTSIAALGSVEPALTYSRLDDLINGWNKELEENERIFLDQATQVNHWDRVITENGDKIANLSSEMERLNVDLGRLDQDLDFIVGQQNETENILRPIEEGLNQLPPSTYQQHTDLQREQIFKMAENLDVELKQVGMDLKEMVEHLNQSNESQDASDPVLQITKILNEHIDSMEWISKNKDLLQKKTNELAIQIENQKNKLPNLLSNKYIYNRY